MMRMAPSSPPIASRRRFPAELASSAVRSLAELLNATTNAGSYSRSPTALFTDGRVMLHGGRRGLSVALVAREERKVGRSWWIATLISGEVALGLLTSVTRGRLSKATALPSPDIRI